jgi:hypothetical protein
MTKYLVSFPGGAMQLSEEDFAQAGIDAHALLASGSSAAGSTRTSIPCSSRPMAR